jgi:transcriptional regulator GlxA family with amidase domain
MQEMHEVTVLAYEGVTALDMCGPLDVLAAATALGASPGYHPRIVSLQGGTIAAANGIRMVTDRADDVSGPLGTLLIPGRLDVSAFARHPEIADTIRRLAERSLRVAAVCTGALLLAQAGLLDGRRATTHWAFSAHLAEHYPGVTVTDNYLYVRDETIWTSAGVTAGMDLTLALVEQDHGSALAREIARWLVLYLRRPGGQSQYSAHLAADQAASAAIRAILAHISERPEQDHSLAALAHRAGLSERQLRRAFRAETGRTPADHVARVRIETAQRLLETTRLPVSEVARRSGFNRTETLDRTFQRYLGTTPNAHRHAFSAT